MINDYEFVTEWRVAGTVDEVTTILGDAGSLSRWWPSVYLSVVVRDPGTSRGVGGSADLNPKGWLPYTLRWSFTITEPITTSGFALQADGCTRAYVPRPLHSSDALTVLDVVGKIGPRLRSQIFPTDRAQIVMATLPRTLPATKWLIASAPRSADRYGRGSASRRTTR